MNWRTAGGELAIVVVGVIIALAGDSWWDRRQAAESETGHLIALQAEFATNLESLRYTMTRLASNKMSATLLLRVIEGEADRPSRDSLVALTWDTFTYPSFEPLTTAYDNLRSTGIVQLLRDEQLRRDLALFAAQIEQYHREDWQLDQWNRVIQPFVIRKLEALDWLTASYRSAHNLPEPTRGTDWESVLRDPEFRGILVNRFIAADDNANVLISVLPTTERIVARLDALLGTGRGP